VVEDEERVRRLMGRYLKDLGYAVLFAENGQSATETLQFGQAIEPLPAFSPDYNPIENMHIFKTMEKYQKGCHPFEVFHNGSISQRLMSRAFQCSRRFETISTMPLMSSV
jgi:CheY-like chemotaxis protein